METTFFILCGVSWRYMGDYGTLPLITLMDLCHKVVIVPILAGYCHSSELRKPKHTEISKNRSSSRLHQSIQLDYGISFVKKPDKKLVRLHVPIFQP